MELMWWAYLHLNGTIQLKRWLGDHRDYTDDCVGNPFVLKVVKPFEARSRDHAMEIATEELRKLGVQMK
jgi:hypothetical protein